MATPRNGLMVPYTALISIDGGDPVENTHRSKDIENFIYQHVTNTKPKYQKREEKDDHLHIAFRYRERGTGVWRDGDAKIYTGEPA